MKCKDCQFWDAKRAWGESKNKASCRAQPPRIRSNAMACDANASWPTTSEDDWCAAFVKKVTTDDALAAH